MTEARPAGDEHRTGDVELGCRVFGCAAPGDTARRHVPATIPSGTLMKKTHRHETQPGQDAAQQSSHRAARAGHGTPGADALWAGVVRGKVVTMMVSVAGDKMAPPIPWIARMVTICVPRSAPRRRPMLARVKRPCR